MAVTVSFYNIFKTSLILNDSNFQWLVDDFNVLLVADSYEFDADMVTIGGLEGGNEVSGGGYTAGGKTLTGRGRVDQSLFADNLSWPASTFSAAGAIIYKAAGGAVMAYVDFGEVVSPSGGEFQLNWGAEGVFVLTS